MSDVRDTRADAAYFTAVVANLDEFCATYDQALAGPGIEGDPPHVLGVKAGDAMKSQWSRFSSLYSLGASSAELVDAFERILAAAERALHLEKEKIPSAMFERRFAFGKNKDFYREWLWLVSVAVAFDVDEAIFDRVVAAVQIGWDDRLIGRLIQTRRPEHAVGTELAFPRIVGPLEKAFDETDPAGAQKAVARYLAKWYPAWKGAWGWGGHELIEKKHYWGYWAFEAAGVVAALGIDDASFRDDEYYPSDLVIEGATDGR